MGARAAVATHGGGRTLGGVVEAVAPGAVADLGSADDDLGGVGSEDPERGGGRLGQDNGKTAGHPAGDDSWGEELRPRHSGGVRAAVGLMSQPWREARGGGWQQQRPVGWLRRQLRLPFDWLQGAHCFRS